MAKPGTISVFKSVIGDFCTNRGYFVETPEPTTLFLLGFGGLALLRKRRE
jgi:hypothetical protein